MNIPDNYGIDTLCRIHGKRPRDLFVILSADGSTLLQDPGLDRAYGTPIRKLAEETAALARASGHPCYACDLETALQMIIRHPKNQPPRRDPS